MYVDWIEIPWIAYSKGILWIRLWTSKILWKYKMSWSGETLTTFNFIPVGVEKIELFVVVTDLVQVFELSI